VDNPVDHTLVLDMNVDALVPHGLDTVDRCLPSDGFDVTADDLIGSWLV
jgi:hypothetical protein